MAKKVIFNRTCAFITAVLLLFPVFGGGAIGNNVLGSPAYEWTAQVAPGTTYYDFAIQTPSGESQQGFLTEYKPSSKVSPVVAYGSGIYGKSDLNYVKNYLEAQGKNVIAGINADFFSLETGIPMGLVVSQGRLISGDDGRSAVGFLENGSAFIGKPELSCELLTGNGPIRIEYVNKKRTAFNAYLLNRDFSEQTRNESPGYDVFLKAAEGAFLQIGKPLPVVVERVEYNSASVSIPEGYLVLTVDANGPADRVAAVQALVSGQTATVMVHTQDPRFEQAFYGVGGGEILLAGGQIQPQSSSAVHPRSALGIKSDGTVVLFEMDGRQSGYSSGLSLQDEARFLQDLGCVEAINLDGGGSSTFAVQYPGEDTANVVNTPSDGSLRKCANFIFLINNTAPSGTAQKLFLYPRNYQILAGSKVQWTPKATDANYNSAPLPAKISYSVPAALGKITGAGLFTAAAQAQVGAISLSGGSAAGSKNIQVIDNPDEIRVVKKGRTTALGSLTLKTGETVALDVLAYKNKKLLLSSTDAFTVTANGEIGSVGADLTFTASDVEGRSGTIAIAYKDMVKTIQVTVGNAPETVEDFENRANNWAAAQQNQTGGTVWYETGYDYVRYGRASLGLSYDFSHLLPEQRALLAAPISSGWIGEAAYLNLWVFGDGSNNILLAQFTQGNVAQTIDFTGWKQLSLPLPAGEKGELKALSVAAAEGKTTAGTIYIDQITASYGKPLTDETAPVITQIQQEGDGEQNLLTARITDPDGATLSVHTISVWLDGQKTDFAYDPSTGLVTSIVLPAMAPGTHKVTVEAKDASGNIGRLTTTKVIGETAATAFADMGSHWSRSFVDFIAQRGIVGGVVENNIAYFQPERAINRAEFAVVMTRYLGLNPEDFAAVEVPFSDMEAIPPWALNYVKAMYAKGIILGRGTGEGKVVFAPLAPVTRAEAATMMGKTLQKGYTGTQTAFKDQKAIPAWGAPYVRTLTALGVISGYEDKSFRPSNNVKRGEVAKMLYSLY